MKLRELQRETKLLVQPSVDWLKEQIEKSWDRQWNNSDMVLRDKIEGDLLRGDKINIGRVCIYILNCEDIKNDPEKTILTISKNDNAEEVLSCNAVLGENTIIMMGIKAGTEAYFEDCNADISKVHVCKAHIENAICDVISCEITLTLHANTF